MSLVSDYRFRGVSLSRDKPAAQATLAYDAPSGWYGGVFASTVDLAGESATTAQALAYAGVVAPLGGGYHWEAGLDYSAFSGSHDYDYGEVYAGIASADFNARVHYSPDYFGLAHGSFYGEVNATHPLGEGFALLGHVGVLVPVGEGVGQSANAVRNPVDARAGLALEIAGYDFQVAWVGTNGTGSLYPVNGAQHRNTAIASVSRSF